MSRWHMENTKHLNISWIKYMNHWKKNQFKQTKSFRNMDLSKIQCEIPWVPYIVFIKKLTTARKQRFKLMCQVMYIYTIKRTQFHGWLKPSQLHWAKHCPETLFLIRKIFREDIQHQAAYASTIRKGYNMGDFCLPE